MRAKPNTFSRVVIEDVQPEIDCGRFAVKRVVGEHVEVEADIYTDGHDALRAEVMHRAEGEPEWSVTAMELLVNDRWRGRFRVSTCGGHRFTVRAWIDRFGSWRRDLLKKVEAGQRVEVELLGGAELLEQAAESSESTVRERLENGARSLRGEYEEALEAALDDELLRITGSIPDPVSLCRYQKELAVTVDRERARYSTWYELFPRSASADPGRQHGTFDDVIARLPYVARLGFDVLYLPPVHPIGTTNRKGKNNAVLAEPGDVGSPWAIGAEAGGHDAVHPDLGTVDDFERLVRNAKAAGMEIALDLALQCSPDHPWVAKHPEWFRKRPDGSIQYAENPPKKYQDIYPLDFETPAWRELWDEVRHVVELWIERGVTIFRVDNPHTKPFRFWEWLIEDVKAAHPEVIFLSEAFTRPKVMYQLAKLGFTQSYTYFAWRNQRWEIVEYFTELTQTRVREFFRPNLWPNTPDILTEHLQYGGRPAFAQRLVLAATLGASYGMYGPAFELQEHMAVSPGKEEYLHSEKYEVRHWDVDREDSLAGLVARINGIRRENPALQSDSTLRFHGVDNEALICYSKVSEDRSNAIVVVVNLDPHYTQSGWVDLALDELGLDSQQPYQVHDLLTEARYMWHGARNYVELNPHVIPAHVFRVRRRTRSEHDFEYFL